jgi:hypothetical protein
LGGCTVSWKATLQSTIVLSTIKAEYMAIIEGVKEAIWLKGLLEEISAETDSISVFCDSHSIIHLAKD